MCVCLCVCKVVNYATLVEDAQKVPFSIATTLWCWGEGYYFPWIAPHTLDLYLISLRDKQGGIKYHF